MENIPKKYRKHVRVEKDGKGSGSSMYNVLLCGELIGAIRERKEKDSVRYIPLYLREDEVLRPLCNAGNWNKTLYEAKNAAVNFCLANPQKKEKSKVKKLPEHPDAEFYPTPEKTAGKLLSPVRWAQDMTILEPSAGKGDLCTALRKAAAHNLGDRYGEKYTMDCIEIDKNLQHILVGKGYRLVYDDFLQFTSHKAYDLIAMNPPFSNGCEHLLHAIELQKQHGGQICCVLNAETIRNPYSKRRTVLCSALKTLGAKICFLKNAFTNAERTTDVDVALIYISIPKPDTHSFIMDNLKKAEEYKEITREATELVSGDFIERLVQTFNFEVEMSLRLIEEYNAITPYILNSIKTNPYSYPLLSLKVGDNANLCINKYLQKVREKYWEHLFDMPELTEKFTSNIHSQYAEKVSELKDYDFNLFNIKRVILQMNANLTDGIKESIEQLFHKMTEEHAWYPECTNNIHYYTGWKTNKAHCLNNKVILPFNGFGRFCFDKDDLDTQRCYSILSDIEKVFNYLDGCKTSEVSLYNALERAKNTGQTKNIQCKYFDITFYKKGTIHIKFTCPRVVDAMNIYMGKDRDWLPPYYGTIRYSDLSAQDRQTVDEFQGREKYAEVVNNQNAYLIEATASNLKMLMA